MASIPDDDFPTPPSQPSGYWTFNAEAWEGAAVRGRARESQPWGVPPTSVAPTTIPLWHWREQRPWHPEDLVAYLLYVDRDRNRSVWKLWSLRWGVTLQGRDRWARQVDLAFPSWPACRNFVEQTTDLICDIYSVEVLAKSDPDGAKALLWAELVERLGPEAIHFRPRSREFTTWQGPTVPGGSST